MGMPNYDQVNAGDAATPMTAGLRDSARAATNESALGSMSQNVDSAKGLLKGDTGFERGLGRSNPMSDAIAQKTGRSVSLADDQLKFNMQNKAKDAHFDQLIQAQDAVSKEQALNYQKAVARWKAKQQAKQGRAALVGSVLGIGGAIAGGAMGGPGGAMAGSAAGNIVGQAAMGGME
jgi:hypothetical protein